MMLRRTYYWCGLKPILEKFVCSCTECQKRNQQIVKYASLDFEQPKTLMQFVFMDLIEFHPPSSSGNRFALPVICMLTRYTWSIPIKDRTTESVMSAYVDHVYVGFGGSVKILPDNGTELKNTLFTEVVKQLGVEHKIYISLSVKWTY